MFSIHNNVPLQFLHDLRQEFFTRPFCCHLVRGRLQLLFKALLNDQEHLFCLASFAQVNTLLHAAVILVGSLSTPHAKDKTSGSLIYKNVIIGQNVISYHPWLGVFENLRHAFTLQRAD